MLLSEFAFVAAPRFAHDEKPPPGNFATETRKQEIRYTVPPATAKCMQVRAVKMKRPRSGPSFRPVAELRSAPHQTGSQQGGFRDLDTPAGLPFLTHLPFRFALCSQLPGSLDSTGTAALPNVRDVSEPDSGKPALDRVGEYP